MSRPGTCGRANSRANDRTTGSHAAAAMLLLDTNVWLDNYIPTRPGHETARRLLRHARDNDVRLVYAVGTIKDVFYLVASHFKNDVRASGSTVGEAEALVAKELAWSCIDNMRELACAVGADESDVWLASKYRSLHEDLEDNLVLAAAERAGVAYLVTNDQTLIGKSTVAALAPADWLALQGCKA